MSESNIKQLYSNSLLQQYKTAHSVCMAPVVITTTVFAMRDTLGCTVIHVSCKPMVTNQKHVSSTTSLTPRRHRTVSYDRMLLDTEALVIWNSLPTT